MATNETTIVPTELLRTLLDGWAEVTAILVTEAVSAEADAAYDALRELVGESRDLAGLADFLVSEHKADPR